MLHADGHVLDTATTSFQISAPYLPFPDMDPSTIVVVHYDNEIPYPIDTRAKADLQVSFTTPTTVTGTVVRGRFKNEPSGSPKAGDSTNDGGLGKPGLKFWVLESRVSALVRLKSRPSIATPTWATFWPARCCLAIDQRERRAGSNSTIRASFRMC